MQRYFSPSTFGVYVKGVNPQIPADAKPISESLFRSVFVNRSASQRVSADENGLPILIDPPPPPPPTREQIESARLRAYADPLTGSDRYFAEAVRLQAAGAPQEEIDAANADGGQRYAEIQAEFPWP